MLDKLSSFSQRIDISFGRFAIFLIYAWFGILKVVGASPATEMVLELLDKTLPFMDPGLFMILFGLFEVLIGVLFLFPRAFKLALLLIFIHLVTTTLPLFILPHMVWTSTLAPTLEGQYIIKNILIISLILFIISRQKNKQIYV